MASPFVAFCFANTHGPRKLRPCCIRKNRLKYWNIKKRVDFSYTIRKAFRRASLWSNGEIHVARFARTTQGSLTLLYTEKSLKILKYQKISRFFLYNKKISATARMGFKPVSAVALIKYWQNFYFSFLNLLYTSYVISTSFKPLWAPS